MKTFYLFVLIVSSTFISGCMPYIASITYEPTQNSIMTSPQDCAITMGSFTDNRGTDSRWLGAVRNGFGMSVKKLYTDKSTDDVIKNAFSKALKTQGFDLVGDGAKVAVEASIKRFGCNSIFDYEAYAHIQVSILSLPSKTSIYSKSYRTNNTKAGFGGGFYGGYKGMPLLAQNTLSQTIDKFLSDPDFISALTNPPTTEAPNTPSIEDRLQTLEKLKNDGLISAAEYESTRRNLLNSL